MNLRSGWITPGSSRLSRSTPCRTGVGQAFLCRPACSIEDFKGQVWDTHGRPIRYPMPDPDHPELSDWLAGNPHAINLGRIGLEIVKRDGTVAGVSDLRNSVQNLDLWTGIVTSRFEIEGEPVAVTTACHPKLDAIAAKIDSPLVREGRLKVFLDVPGDNGRQFDNFVGDWRHQAKLEPVGLAKPGRADFLRRLGDDSYRVSLTWEGGANLHKMEEQKAPPIEILSAQYGANDKWSDVAGKVREMISKGTLQIQVTNNSFSPDPIPGVGKELRVVYVVNGKTVTATAHENEEVNLDSRSNIHGLVLQPATDSSSLSFVCAFSLQPVSKTLPDASKTVAASAKAWPTVLEIWRRRRSFR